MTRQVSGFVIATVPDFAITRFKRQSAYFLTLKWQIQNCSCPAVFGPSHVTAVPASHWWRAGWGGLSLVGTSGLIRGVYK